MGRGGSLRNQVEVEVRRTWWGEANGGRFHVAFVLSKAASVSLTAMCLSQHQDCTSFVLRVVDCCSGEAGTSGGSVYSAEL